MSAAKKRPAAKAKRTARKKTAAKKVTPIRKKATAKKKAAAKKRTGRPRKPQRKDLDQVEELAAIGLPETDIGRIVYGLSRSGFRERKKSDSDLSVRLEKGRSSGRQSLTKKMWDMALLDGNATMCIWLSKQYLGFSDKRETQVTERRPLIIREETDLETLSARAAATTDAKDAARPN